MKNCRKCNVELVIGENWLQSMSNQRNYSCKPCHNSKTNEHYHANSDVYKSQIKKHREKSKNGLFNIYLVDNYVGITDNIPYRKAVHKHYGRNIDNFRILHSTKSREDALELEELLHDIGYEGRHLKNRYA